MFQNGVGLLLQIIKNCMCTVHTHITRDGLVVGGSIPLSHWCDLGSSPICVFKAIKYIDTI